MSAPDKPEALFTRQRSFPRARGSSSCFASSTARVAGLLAKPQSERAAEHPLSRAFLWLCCAALRVLGSCSRSSDGSRLAVIKGKMLLIRDAPSWPIVSKPIAAGSWKAPRSHSEGLGKKRGKRRVAPGRRNGSAAKIVSTLSWLSAEQLEGIWGLEEESQQGKVAAAGSSNAAPLVTFVPARTAARWQQNPAGVALIETWGDPRALRLKLLWKLPFREDRTLIMCFVAQTCRTGQQLSLCPSERPKVTSPSVPVGHFLQQAVTSVLKALPLFLMPWEGWPRAETGQC